MKRLIFALLFFIPSFLFSQVVFTSGLTYTNGAPTHNPGNTGSRYAVDTVNWNWYVRSYGTTWTLVGNNWPQDISGCSAPAYTPTKFQSKVVINSCNPAEMYIWDGANWGQVGGSGATDLSFSGASSPVTLESSTGNGVFFEAGAGVSLAQSGDTLTITNSNPTDDITGSGLANRLAYWTAAGAVGYESSMHVDTPNVSLTIGAQASSTGPVSGVRPEFHSVNGSKKIGLTTKFGSGLLIEMTNGTTNALPGFIFTDNQFYAGTRTAHDYILQRNSNNRVRLGSSGVGIGPTAPTSPRFPLDVISTSDVVSAFSSSSDYAGFLVISGHDKFPFVSFFSQTNPTAGVISGGQRFTLGWDDARSYGLMYFAAGSGGAGGNTCIQFDSATQNINIKSNAIRTTQTFPARLNIIGSGTTSASVNLRAANGLDSVVLYSRNDRRVGVNTATPDLSFQVEGTDGIGYPSGTTAQRTAVNNQIRNNTDVEGVEIRENGVWFRLTSSQAPSIAAGAAAGTGPTVAIGAGSNDLGGTIEITTGTSTTTGTLATITYGDAFDAALNPSVTVTPANDKANEHMLQWRKGTSGNTSFTLTARVALDASTLYVFTYQVQQ